MAYDKVIDSAVLDAGLTATANAIREKTGDTALIQWMNENGFADAVAAIGGGGCVSYGTVVASETGSVQIEHGLGKTPSFFVFGSGRTRSTFDTSSSIYSLIVTKYASANSFSGATFVVLNSSLSLVSYDAVTLIGNMGSYSFNQYFSSGFNETLIQPGGTSYKVEAGIEYHWIAGCYE